MEFLRDLDIDHLGRLLLVQWLLQLAELTERIYDINREVKRVAAEVPELVLLITFLGVSAYSGLLIHAEISDIDRFGGADEVVSYAGLDPHRSGVRRHQNGRWHQQVKERLLSSHPDSECDQRFTTPWIRLTDVY